MEITAAVLYPARNDPSIEQVTLDAPGPSEVLVRITAVGVCHSDLSIAKGVIPQRMPAIVGHESVGVVEGFGQNVTELQLGERVITSWIPQCGICRNCTAGRPQLCDLSHFPLRGLQTDGTTRRHTSDGTDISAMGAVGAFATHAVIPKEAAIRIDDRLPDEVAALIGCAVLTGTGAVWNTAGVQGGSSVAVIGAGGIGLNIIQAAKVAGASTIIAIDPNPTRRSMAAAFGASDTFAPDGAREAVLEITDQRGADYTFEAVGTTETAEAAFGLGGVGSTTVLVGMAGIESRVTLPQFQWVSQERRVLGSWFGSTDLRRDIPRIIELATKNELDLQSLVTSVRPLSELASAFDDLESGSGLRTVIRP